MCSHASLFHLEVRALARSARDPLLAGLVAAMSGTKERSPAAQGL
jgi:hypothetical protein